MSVCVHVCVHTLSHVQLFSIPWTIAHQAPLSVGFSRQGYWSGLPFPSPENLPDPGIEATSLASPALTSRFFTTSATWEFHQNEEAHKMEHVMEKDIQLHTIITRWGRFKVFWSHYFLLKFRTVTQRSLITTHFHYSNSPHLAVGRQKTAPTEIPQPWPETSIS